MADAGAPQARRDGPAVPSAELAVLSGAWPLEAGKPVQLSTTRAMFFQTGGGFEAFVEVCTMLMIAVVLVLLIGWSNLTNLMATKSGRQHEVALRLALGASRGRLVRQFCVQSLVLGLVGGTAALFLSAWVCSWLGAKAMELIQEIGNGALSVSMDLAPDWRVFAFAAALSIITSIAEGFSRPCAHLEATLAQG